ncbi:hypothetical protein V8C86DRAFT_2437713 [Haematococcus lacustris]
MMFVLVYQRKVLLHTGASASMQVGNTSDTLVASTNTSKGAGSALIDEDMQPLYSLSTLAPVGPLYAGLPAVMVVMGVPVVVVMGVVVVVAHTPTCLCKSARSDNLEQDLAPFAQQRKQYAMPELVRTAAGLRVPSSLGEFLFVKGKMHGAPILDDPSSLARQRMDALITASAEASRQGTPLPDTVFLLNLHEQPRYPPGLATAPSLTNRSPGNASRLRSPCLAPVLSMFKTWSARNTSHHADLLLPAFDHSHTRSMSLNCTRLRLHNLALSKEGRRWLDVGITATSHPRLRLNLSRPIHLAEWTLWKYLVHTDSITASSTLATLLGSSSLVLKQRSPYIEYYYRSLQPGRLFHEFAADTSDILKVIEGLEAADRAGDPSLQAMVKASNAFHHRFLTTAAKVMTVLWHSLKGHAAQPMLGPWYAWQGPCASVQLAHWHWQRRAALLPWSHWLCLLVTMHGKPCMDEAGLLLRCNLIKSC